MSRSTKSLIRTPTSTLSERCQKMHQHALERKDKAIGPLPQTIPTTEAIRMATLVAISVEDVHLGTMLVVET